MILDSSRTPADFDANVFINCPFDEAYLQLLRPLLFTVVYLGYQPRIALERSDSGENRVDKIRQLIAESRCSIHDLSRLQAGEAGEFYRLNMPFELGLDQGARFFGGSHLQTKRCLILERNLYDYKRALSDLSGVDIKNHRDDPEEIIRAVRDWFVETLGLRAVPTAGLLWRSFNEYSAALYDELQAAGSPRLDVDRLPVPEYVDYIRRWLEQRSE